MCQTYPSIDGSGRQEQQGYDILVYGASELGQRLFTFFYLSINQLHGECLVPSFCWRDVDATVFPDWEMSNAQSGLSLCRWTGVVFGGFWRQRMIPFRVSIYRVIIDNLILD